MMVKLGDLGQIITGNTPKTNEKHNYNSKDICFVKPSDIDEENISLIEKSVFYISERARNKSKIVPKNSILVTCIGIIGKVAITNVECAFNQQINGIVLEESKCIPNYVAYAIQFQKKYIQEVANNAVVPILNKTQFSNIEISLPSLEEQRKIAKTLDKVSDLIAKRKQQLEKLDLLVKSKFVEMFGDINSSELYPYKKIKDFTIVISGGTPDRNNSEYWDNGCIPWVKTTELQNSLINETQEKITVDGMKNSSAKLVPPNTILLAMYGQGKTRGMTGYLGFESTTNQACACILPSETINQKYLWKYLIFSYDKLRNLAKGGNQPNLNCNMIKEFEVLFPPIELQNKFADFVQQTEQSKILINKSLEKMETLKKALMQEYFG